MNNVVCLKWGTKYSSMYVNILYSMVKRNLTLPYRFVCFTDDKNGINPEIECKPILPTCNNTTGWWHKLSFFSEKIDDLTGTILFLDLDVVIVDNIDEFFTHPGNFCIMLDKGYTNSKIYNSSVFRMEIGKYNYIYNDYIADHKNIIRRLAGDQNFITEKISDAILWPDIWCQSYKYNICGNGHKYATLSEGMKIIIFHGHPNPDEAILGWPSPPPKELGIKFHQRYKPCSWIQDYWK